MKRKNILLEIRQKSRTKLFLSPGILLQHKFYSNLSQKMHSIYTKYLYTINLHERVFYETVKSCRQSKF